MDTTAESLKASSPGRETSTGPLAVWELAEVLEQHTDWLESGGSAGFQANLSREALEGVDLVDAKLQNAVFNKTNLSQADLTLADLRESSLLQANLQGANLLGTMFQQANLQAANLDGATGLVVRQLAGANLFGAILPAEVSPSEGLKHVKAIAANAGWFLAAILVLCTLVWVRVLTTRDYQLLKNAPALPFLGLQSDLPFVAFYLFGPVAILIAYVFFHLYLQRVWDGAAQLPAIFPDGRNLDTCLPLYARWSVRKHFKSLRSMRSPLAFLEEFIAIFLLYWVVPASVLLFWCRYLTLEDLRGTIVHVLLVTGAVTAAISFPRMVGKAFGSDQPKDASATKSLPQMLVRFEIVGPVLIGLILSLLSIGTTVGAPHGAGFKTWAADILWTAGYNPFARLTETDVSTKPPGWSGQDKDLALVKGANLNQLHLRYIEAYGAFFAKTHLWQADLRNAYLSEADLRGANLRQADLRFAVLDRARLANASLQEADLRNANLNRADLHESNLVSAVASGATFLDATLDGANIYNADLRNVILQRASLKQADFREANLEGADLTMANLQETYLTSTRLAGARLRQADLSLAILTDTDLRKADLTGADLRGAILRGADLTGANVQDANFVGAVGLTAQQICVAANWSRAQIDANLEQDVRTNCGNNH